MWRQASLPAVGRHLAARKKHRPGEAPEWTGGFLRCDAVPPGWKPRLYVSQDGRRYHFQTVSETPDLGAPASLPANWEHGSWTFIG